ncbi:hypothetical protein MKW92_017782 [Papaver armeniacum]|nr:hypothetical protein MKW92_017782 [Papaver armeniacum]
MATWAVTKLTSRAAHLPFSTCISKFNHQFQFYKNCSRNRRRSKITIPSSTRSISSTISSSLELGQAEGGRESKMETKKITAPYGSWKSPITADVVSGADKRLGGIAVDGHGHLLWVETRPNEAGRAVLVKEADKYGDEPIDITPKEFAVRTLANEYGGQAFTISGDAIVFSNYKDQRLYKQIIGDSSPLPITPDYGESVVRYADGVFDSHSNSYITVMEDHRESSLNAITTIVSVSLSDGIKQDPKLLVGGNDFYAFPRVDPKGERLAWIEWGHPNMQWDKAELWVGYISKDGDISRKICVAGGDPTLVESPSEPKWSPKGELFFITDRKNGFWNLYKWSGRSYLGVLDDAQNSLTAVDVPFTDIGNIVCGCDCLYVEGASGTQPLSVAKVVLDDNKSQAVDFSIMWSSSPDSTKYKSYFSMPEPIEFPTEVAGQKAYAYFYPPTNPCYQASEEEKPPLLLKIHGNYNSYYFNHMGISIFVPYLFILGPTSESRGILDLNIQYWTSRGWAFVDVNHGGVQVFLVETRYRLMKLVPFIHIIPWYCVKGVMMSLAGYGREFRERLLGSWGIVDVNDCCSCTKFLVDSGKVDGERLCITGRSAGGYTTLASLAFRQTFKAGASLYGIADLNSLKTDTHKFESRYTDNLLGSEEAYFERSPINFVDKFSCPVILFQGLEDKVVTPDQARKIYTALKQKGLPVALVEYEGEQHGFRKAENIKYTLEQQMVFFARLIGNFKVADEITPLKIDNLD